MIKENELPLMLEQKEYLSRKIKRKRIDVYLFILHLFLLPTFFISPGFWAENYTLLGAYLFVMGFYVAKISIPYASEKVLLEWIESNVTNDNDNTH